MPRYVYKHLRVICLEAPYFPLDQLREAVEHLRTVPQTGYTGLQATTSYKDDVIFLLAQPMLQLKDIEGKTPADVWEMFDKEVDWMVKDHRNRRLRPFKVN